MSDGKRSPAPIPGGKYIVNGEYVNAEGESLNPDIQAAKIRAQIASLQAMHDAIIAGPLDSQLADDVIDPNGPPPEGHVMRKAWAAKKGLIFPGNISAEKLQALIDGIPK